MSSPKAHRRRARHLVLPVAGTLILAVIGLTSASSTSASSTWGQVGAPLVGQADADSFGHSVSLAGNTSRVAVGAITNDDGAPDAGHVRVYEQDLTSSPSACSPATTSHTSGSTIYTVVAFKSVGTCSWAIPSGVTMFDWLVVGGGGGGGSWHGAGGGAGGMRSNEGLNVPLDTSFTIQVGAGGDGAPELTSGSPNAIRGYSGGASRITGSSSGVLASVLGGGGGGSGTNRSADPGHDGADGGSGGGSQADLYDNSQGDGSILPGSGTHGEGYNGGAGAGGGVPHTAGTAWVGGGGGGAGGNGGGAGETLGNVTAGDGGNGNTITWISASAATTLGIGEVDGSDVYFAGGGAGAGDETVTYTLGTGGLGGGGDGSFYADGSGEDGAASTGGGGAGSSLTAGGATRVGGAGGSGVVVLRYQQTAYSITYDANGGSGAAPSDTEGVLPLTLASGDALTSEAMAFLRWNTLSDGSGTDYMPGSAYSTEANLALFAIYEQDPSLSWAPTTAITATDSPLTPDKPSYSGGGALTYSVTDAGTTGCTVNSGTGELTFTAVGSCIVRASVAANGDYVADSADVIFVISAASQTITFADLADRAWSASTFDLSPTTSAVDLSVTLVSDTTDVCTVAGFTVTMVTTGTCTLTASQAGNSTYAAATDVTHSFDITPASQTITFEDPADRVWSASTFDLSPTTDATGLTVTLTSDTTDVCTVTGFTVTMVTAGTCTLTASQAGNSTYAAATDVTHSFDITAAAQAIAFTSTVPSTPLPGGTYTPAATATSGLTPTFSITAGDTAVCTLSSGVVTFDATGTCTITATQTGDSRYAAAATQTQTITVGALNQTINVTIPDDVNYGTPGFTLDTDTTSALDVTVTPTNSDICTITGLIVTPVDIGDCELTITQAGNSSYAAASPVTINFRILPTVPTAPTITSVSAGNANATIAFTAPGFTGGVNLSAYTITATPTTGDPINNTTCTTGPCTITGLANGTAYTLTITANNTAGAGPASTPSPAVTPATRATAVTTLAATPGDSTINVTWDEPDNFGGGTFIRYELRVTAAGEAMPTNATAMITDASVGAHTLTGLDNGTAYDVEVVTITSANQTAITGNTATLSTVPVSTPAAPTDVGVNTISPRVIHLAWAEPERNGGAPVSGYVVTITGGDGTSVECGTITIVDGARTADCTSALLQLSTTYTITIAAENRIGTGAAASVTHTTPTFTAPTTPPDITIDDDTECPCLFDADGNPVPVDIERTEPGVTPGSVTIDDGVIALGDTTTRPGHATTWVDADGQLVAQTPGSLPLSGSNALPGTTVTIFVDGVAAGTATVNPDGTWTLDLDLPDGINGTITMTIVWIDENGEQRTLTTPLTIIATGDAATAPRTTSNSTQLAPGPDSVIATGPNGELLDSTRNVDSTGNSVIVTAGDSVVRISPAENGRIDPTGRLVLTHPSRVRVTGDNMLPGATATIWVMSSPQQLGTVIVAADGTIDATYAIPTGIDPGDHTIQIDTADANGRALSIAMGLTITTGVLPVTGASTHSHLAWLTLMLALGALTALTASGHRRQRGAPRH